MPKKEWRFYYNPDTRKTEVFAHPDLQKKYESDNSWIRVVGRKDTTPFKSEEKTKKKKKIVKKQ